MALFKIYRGDRAELPEKKTDGYAYFCADTGEFFIDVNLSGNESDLERKQLNAYAANKLMKDFGDDEHGVIEIDDIVLKTETIDVEHGGTGVKELAENGVLVGDGKKPVKTVTGEGVLYSDTENGLKFVETVPLTAGGTGGSDAEEARKNLGVYSKEEVDQKLLTSTTVAYNHTIRVVDWVEDPAGFAATWTQPALKCGASEEVLVPPEITFKTNREEYSKIDSAEAERGKGIIFYIKEKPSNDIEIIIIDQM